MTCLSKKITIHTNMSRTGKPSFSIANSLVRISVQKETLAVAGIPHRLPKSQCRVMVGYDKLKDQLTLSFEGLSTEKLPAPAILCQSRKENMDDQFIR